MKRFLGAALFAGGLIASGACGGASVDDIVGTSSNATNADSDSGTSSSAIDGGSSIKTDSGGGSTGTDSGTGNGVDSGGGNGNGSCTIDASGTSIGCKTNEYCVSNNCATGTCSPIPTPTDNTYDAQCGCDNVNYWNAEVAHGYGQSVKSAGTCANAITCTTGKCASGSYGCEIQQNACAVTTGSATQCWGVPATCPEGNGVTMVRACNGNIGGKCGSQCDAFTQKTPYVLAAECN